MKNQRRFSGQSLIEFAIILPLAFFLITGFLDLGRAVFYYSSLTNAVREATRYAIVHKAEIEDALTILPIIPFRIRYWNTPLVWSDVPDPLNKR